MRTYFHARAKRKVYVELSKEDFEEGRCGLLKIAMYGTRDAEQNWELGHTEMTTEADCRQGSFGACVFYHKQKNVRVVVHGDDFTALGPSKSLDWFRGAVQQGMEVKFKERLVRGQVGASVRTLNKIVTVTDEGLEYEADQRRAEILMRNTGIEESSEGVVTQGVACTAEGGNFMRKKVEQNEM